MGTNKAITHMDRTSFWKLKASSKLDILEEGTFNHNSVILRALTDPETCIECVDDTRYTLYGNEEALLVQSVSLHLRIGLLVYALFMTLFRH